MHSQIMSETGAAMEWSMEPSRFKSLDPHDQAVMMALVEARLIMQEWEALVREEETENELESKKNNPFR